MRKMVLAAVVFAMVALAVAAQTAKPVVNSFTDSRDGKTYRTVKIGSRMWLAQNLNYVTEDSKCYDNDPANCAKYGRLYNWDDLVQAAGGSEAAGKKLKSTSGWHSNGNGTDDFGFSALPSGSRHIRTGKYKHGDTFFLGIGKSGDWWSVTKYGTTLNWYRCMLWYADDVFDDGNEQDGLAVRCVQDGGQP